MATYIREKNTNGGLVALLIILVVAAIAAAIWFFSGETETTRITVPQPTNEVELETPNAIELPEAPVAPMDNTVDEPVGVGE